MSQLKKGDGDSSVARLVRLAGARDVPAEDKMQRARSAAHAAWQRGLQTTETPMRKRFIRLTIGDRVRLQMSPYDTGKARIVYRLA